jgi:hypothetical protein
MKKKSVLVVFVIIFFVAGAFATLVRSADAPRMTKDELMAMLGNPDLIIIDVRYGKDWTESDVKIKGAVREDPEAFDSWAKKYPKDKTLVFYCA